jgi:hypothetical protein
MTSAQSRENRSLSIAAVGCLRTGQFIIERML